MTRQIPIILGMLAAYTLGGCASTGQPAAARAGDPSIHYTLVNLHPDEGRLRLYTMNYQQRGLIPRCTAVRFVETRASFAIFEVASSGRRYMYLTHSSLHESLSRHLDRYFGRRCDPATVAALSEVDRDGIARGKALPGMTKDGVTLAIGYPPEHVTPDRQANVWTYWKSRSQKFAVEFADGKVARVKE